MVSFRIARKNISYLVKAQIYPFVRTVDSFKCNKSRFHTYLNVNGTDTFTSTVTRKTYKISHLFDCSDKYLIYLLTCKKCLIQYVCKIVKMCFTRDGTIAKIIIETMIVISHASRGIYINITQAFVTVDY